jgi:hypothetical protein
MPMHLLGLHVKDDDDFTMKISITLCLYLHQEHNLTRGLPVALKLNTFIWTICDTRVQRA